MTVILVTGRDGKIIDLLLHVGSEVAQDRLQEYFAPLVKTAKKSSPLPIHVNSGHFKQLSHKRPSGPYHNLSQRAAIRRSPK